MKILITGGHGFIGQYLRDALFGEHELYRPHEAEMDLRNWESVVHCVKTLQPDCVVHLGARTEVAFSFDAFEDFQDVNYLGTVRLAEANRLFNPNLKQFVFASTMETYGKQPDAFEEGRIPFIETTEQHPIAPYAVAKLACEKYLAYMQHAYKFPATVLRQSNTYGRVNTDFFVVEAILTQMMEGDVCHLGEPGTLSNFLFIDDLIELYLAVIGNHKAIGETFVTGPANALTIKELADTCAHALHWTGKLKWHTKPSRPGEVWYLNSLAAKAERILGWKPKTALEDGLCETIDRIENARAFRIVA